MGGWPGIRIKFSHERPSTMTGPRRQPRPPRVMIVTTMPSTVDVFLIEQIRGLEKAGFAVTVITSPDERLGGLRTPGIDMIPLSIPRTPSPWALAKALAGLVRIFTRHRPDIIHTHTPIAALLGQVAARLTGVPVRLTTVHGLYFVNVPRLVPRALYRILETVACRLATHVICVSAEDARYLIREHAFRRSRMSVMHVGVNLDEFSPAAVGPGARAAVRHEMGIPENAFVFGTVARMVREKGLIELFEAFSRLAADDPNVYLLHVGPADDARPDAVTIEDAQRFPASDRMRFAGHRYDVARFLAAMDVFCLPTHREGYPVSVMEAAAMGLPAIVTDIRGCREAVTDGETGLIVPIKDVPALEMAMRRMVGMNPLRQGMALSAIRGAIEYFDRRKIVRQTAALYIQAQARTHFAV